MLFMAGIQCMGCPLDSNPIHWPQTPGKRTTFYVPSGSTQHKLKFLNENSRSIRLHITLACQLLNPSGCSLTGRTVPPGSLLLRACQLSLYNLQLIFPLSENCCMCGYYLCVLLSHLRQHLTALTHTKRGFSQKPHCERRLHDYLIRGWTPPTLSLQKQ